jgi:hypothetical protein
MGEAFQEVAVSINSSAKDNLQLRRELPLVQTGVSEPPSFKDSTNDR